MIDINYLFRSEVADEIAYQDVDPTPKSIKSMQKEKIEEEIEEKKEPQKVIKKEKEKEKETPPKKDTPKPQKEEKKEPEKPINTIALKPDLKPKNKKKWEFPSNPQKKEEKAAEDIKTQPTEEIKSKQEEVKTNPPVNTLPPAKINNEITKKEPEIIKPTPIVKDEEPPQPKKTFNFRKMNDVPNADTKPAKEEEDQKNNNFNKEIKEEKPSVLKVEPTPKVFKDDAKIDKDDPIKNAGGMVEKPQISEDSAQQKKAFNFKKISEEQKKVPEKVEEKKAEKQEDDLFAKFESYDPAEKYKSKKQPESEIKKDKPADKKEDEADLLQLLTKEKHVQPVAAPQKKIVVEESKPVKPAVKEEPNILDFLDKDSPQIKKNQNNNTKKPLTKEQPDLLDFLDKEKPAAVAPKAQPPQSQPKKEEKKVKKTALADLEELEID